MWLCCGFSCVCGVQLSEGILLFPKCSEDFVLSKRRVEKQCVGQYSTCLSVHSNQCSQSSGNMCSDVSAASVERKVQVTMAAGLLQGLQSWSASSSSGKWQEVETGGTDLVSIENVKVSWMPKLEDAPRQSTNSQRGR